MNQQGKQVASEIEDIIEAAPNIPGEVLTNTLDFTLNNPIAGFLSDLALHTAVFNRVQDLGEPLSPNAYLVLGSGLAEVISRGISYRSEKAGKFTQNFSKWAPRVIRAGQTVGGALLISKSIIENDSIKKIAYFGADLVEGISTVFSATPLGLSEVVRSALPLTGYDSGQAGTDLLMGVMLLKAAHNEKGYRPHWPAVKEIKQSAKNIYEVLKGKGENPIYQSEQKKGEQKGEGQKMDTHQFNTTHRSPKPYSVPDKSLSVNQLYKRITIAETPDDIQKAALNFFAAIASGKIEDTKPLLGLVSQGRMDIESLKLILNSTPAGYNHQDWRQTRQQLYSEMR